MMRAWCLYHHTCPKCKNKIVLSLIKLFVKKNNNNNKLAIKTKCEIAIPIIYVEIIHIAVGFYDFEFKQLIKNKGWIFDRISQLGMRILSNNKLAIKTKCEIIVPIILCGNYSYWAGFWWFKCLSHYLLDAMEEGGGFEM